MMPRRGREAGFTLLEVLVALVVFGFLMAGLAQGFRFGVQAMGLQATAVRQQDDIETVDRALRGLLHRTAHFNTALANPLFSGGAHELAFGTLLPRSGEGAAQLVDVGLGVDPQRRLVLRWSPSFAKPLGPLPPPSTVVLLQGVDHIDVSYWEMSETKPRWVTTWPQGDIPELVRLRLVFAQGGRPGGRRYWPDIVAATRGG